MSPMRKRKRNHEHSLNRSERGKENTGCACKVSKVDHEVPQRENNSPEVRLPILRFIAFSRSWLSSVAHDVSRPCMLTESKELTDSYIDPDWRTSTHPDEPPPLFDSVDHIASLSSLHTAPLTEENLQALDEAMPVKKDAGVGATTASSAESINRAFHVMKRNNIFLEKQDAKERGKGIIQEAKRIVNDHRHSVLSASQSEALSKTAAEMSLDDELTFMVGVWNLVIGTYRTVKDMDVPDKLVFVETAWEKDDLKCNWGSPFAANLTPPLRFADPEMEAFADVIPKLRNSVPDMTYGYHEKTFTPEQMCANEVVKGEICRRNWHPFLLIEAKSIDLPFQQGVAQALRAAAATINLKRKLMEEARPTVITGSKTTEQHNADSSKSTVEHDTSSTLPNPNIGVAQPISGQHRYKADMSSFIFTFVICPDLARLFVAWAEEAWSSNNNDEPGINYHMHALKHYHFSDGGDAWAALHHDLNNVLDWGVGPRKTQVLNMLNDVANKKKDGKERARTWFREQLMEWRDEGENIDQRVLEAMARRGRGIRSEGY